MDVPNYSQHVGHLTSDQEKKLDEFKTILENKGIYKRPNPPDEFDDTTLIRYLRARNWHIDGAVHQYEESAKWRSDHDIDELYDNFNVDEFVYSQKTYPLWTGRFTKSGMPLYVYRVADLTKEVVDKYNKEHDRVHLRMMVLYEIVLKFVFPFSTSVRREKPGGDPSSPPVDGLVTIADVSNMGLTRFWQLRSHMQRASVQATAHYPETLGGVFIVGAPRFFSTVWGWIGKWFDKGTVDKIQVLAHDDVFSTLSKYIDVKDIPKCYGGELDWDYGNTTPNLDAFEQKLLGRDKLPPGPVRWDTKTDKLWSATEAHQDKN